MKYIHSSDGTIGFDKRVLSLDDISVSGFVGALGVSGESVLDAVSVVVLWMGIIWFWGGNDSLGNNWSSGIGDWVCDLCVGGLCGICYWSGMVGGLMYDLLETIL